MKNNRKYIPLNIQKFSDEIEAGKTIQINGSATLTDVDTTKESRVLRLLGQTSQDGTPTPSSPIPVNVVSGDNYIDICGKNLLNIETTIPKRYVSYTNGIVRTSDDWSVSDFIPIQGNTNYILSGITNSGWTAGTCFYDKDKTFISSIYTTAYSFTTPSNAKYVRLSLNSETPTNVMLEKGSSATSYEPYQGNTYNIDLPVENLFDDSTLNNKWVAQNGTITTVTGANCIKYNCSANDTYTLSATFGTSNPNNIIVMAFYNSSDTLLNRYVATTNASLTMTYTAPANTSYMYAGHYGVVSTTMQLEKGSKQNNFTPYGTTPIELCKIGTYQDYIYKDSGKWYLHKEIGKVVLDGSERGWGRSGSSSNDVFVGALNLNQYGIGIYSKQSTASSWLVNRFSYGTLGTLNKFNVYNPDATYGYNNIGFGISTDIVNDIDTFKTWVSTHNTTVYYVLATPTNTEITDTLLLSQLNDLESE